MCVWICSVNQGIEAKIEEEMRKQRNLFFNFIYFVFFHVQQQVYVFIQEKRWIYFYCSYSIFQICDSALFYKKKNKFRCLSISSSIYASILLFSIWFFYSLHRHRHRVYFFNLLKKKKYENMEEKSFHTRIHSHER